MLKVKRPVDTRYSRYGTFTSYDSIAFERQQDLISNNIYTFCEDAITVLFDAYPDVAKAVVDKNVKLLKKIAAQISKELVEFSPYIGADISIIYDVDAFDPDFKIILRDPNNFGNTFLVNFDGAKKRSYVDAQLNVVAAFLLDKQANHRYQAVSQTDPIVRADKCKV